MLQQEYQQNYHQQQPMDAEMYRQQMQQQQYYQQQQQNPAMSQQYEQQVLQEHYRQEEERRIQVRLLVWPRFQTQNVVSKVSELETDLNLKSIASQMRKYFPETLLAIPESKNSYHWDC